MNADERRLRRVTQWAKVDGAFLEAVLWAGAEASAGKDLRNALRGQGAFSAGPEDKPALRAGPSGASKAPRRPLPALIRVHSSVMVSPLLRGTNRFERFSKSSLRLSQAFPEVPDSQTGSAKEPGVSENV